MRTGIAFLIILLSGMGSAFAQIETRPRARDIGIEVGVLPPGPRNAITDVAGVEVGQSTIIRGDNLRTGVTAILPHGGNLYQANEMGEIETPILLTGTDSVFRAADALVAYVFNLKGNENVLSVNPLVGETNDGYLSDIRSRPITPDDVFAAIHNVAGGPVEEGVVGAGTGTIAFSWKGGIGTSSRRLPSSLGGYTVGVLVQTNFGGNLMIAGVPIGAHVSGHRIGSETCHGRAEAADAGWLLHDRGGNGCSHRSSQPGAAGGTGEDGPGTDGVERIERQRRLRDCILELS
jgi:D-aminopeptidase